MERKTLANCESSEFLRQIYKMIVLVADLYKAVDFNALKEKHKDDENTSGYLIDLFGVFMDANAEKTVEAIGMGAFMTREEAEKTAPADLLEIFMELVESERVVDFFMKSVNLMPRLTAIISRRLT